MSVATIVYAIYLMRVYKKQNPIDLRRPKSVDKSRTNTKVLETKSDTAQIPVVAERPYANEPRTGATDRHAQLNLDSVELSRFARTRIAQELNRNFSHGVFEIRKPLTELFFQLEKRHPTGEIAKKRLSRDKDKTRIVLEPRSTIYGELFFFIMSLGVVTLPYLLGFFAMPEWLTALTNPIESTSPIPSLFVSLVPTLILVIGGILMIWSVFALYRKWAYIHYWRLVLVMTSPENGMLVRINRPYLLGGSAASLHIQKVEHAFHTTGKSERDEEGFRSMTAQALRLRWIVVDLIGEKDVRFNWMGPVRVREAVVCVDIINTVSSGTRDPRN